MAVAPGFGFWMGFAGARTSSAGGSCARRTAPTSRTSKAKPSSATACCGGTGGSGYAREGARELIRYGFEELGLDRIFAQTMAVNTPSRATMASAGLTFARAFTSATDYDDPVEGAERGEVEYEITRRTWLEPQRACSPAGSTTAPAPPPAT